MPALLVHPVRLPAPVNGLRQLGPEDADTVARRATLAFGPAEGDQVERWTRRLEAGAVWGWGGPEVVAHAVVTTVEHWFGGRRVPCQNVASVAIAPEDRGRGAARALMEALVRHGAGEGLGLSLLFPATSRLYRSLGYEHAGELARYRLAARSAPPVGEPMRQAGEEDWEAIQRCAERANARRSGPAARPDSRWAEVAKAEFWYVLDGPEGVDGYILFDQVRDPGDWQYRLSVTDWAAATARGLEAVVGFLGRHGTLGKAATFRGPVPDVWALYTPEEDTDWFGGLWWMARGLDLPTAVSARTYPPGLSGTVTFSIDDPLLEDARGPWRLEVADRQGQLTPAGAATVRLDVRAFGPLYTGFRVPADLVLGGLAEGPEPDLAFLGATFSGPVPHLLDFF